MQSKLLRGLGTLLLTILAFQANASEASRDGSDRQSNAEIRRPTADEASNEEAKADPKQAQTSSSSDAKGPYTLGYCTYRCMTGFTPGGGFTPPTFHSGYFTFQQCCVDTEYLCNPGENAIGVSFNGQKCLAQ